MTPQKIRDMSAAVAQHFGWHSEQMCEGYETDHIGGGIPNCPRCNAPVKWESGHCPVWYKTEPHRTPPPDLTTPEWFVRVLTELRGTVGWSTIDKAWWCGLQRAGGYADHADTPELALLKAAYELVKK